MGRPMVSRWLRCQGEPLNLIAPLLALCSALAWGIGDFSGGIASRRGHVAVTLVATQVIGLVATAVLLAVSSEPMPTLAALGWSAAAGVSGIIGLGCLYVALARGTMGLVAPLVALIGAAIPAAVGLISGQAASLVLVSGLAVALAAVVIISLPASVPIAEGIPAASPRRLSELGLIVVAGLGFAGFYLAVDQSRMAGGETFWPLLVVRSAGGAVAAIGSVYLLMRARPVDLRVRRRVLPILLLAGLGEVGGNVFFVLANQAGPLAVAVVLSSLYPVITTLLARVFLRERLGRVRMTGVVLAIVGIVLIALG